MDCKQFSKHHQQPRAAGRFQDRRAHRARPRGPHHVRAGRGREHGGRRRGRPGAEVERRQGEAERDQGDGRRRLEGEEQDQRQERAALGKEKVMTKRTKKKKNKRTVKVLSHAHERQLTADGEFLEELSPGVPATTENDSPVRVRARLLATYVVQRSDTLYGIARSHGLTVEALKKMNNLRGDTIHPGQVLKLEE